MHNILYCVMDESSLGYIDSRQPNTYCPLAPTTVWMNGPLNVGSSRFRVASEEDFNRYRVSLPPEFKNAK